MIYEIYLDNKILYYPDDKKYVVFNAELNQAISDSGTLEFDIPKSNPLYDEIKLRKSMIQVVKNDEEIFYGEVREISENFDFSKHIYAVGEMAFLFDSIQPQARYQDKTPLEVFNAMLAIHNAQVDEKKQFEVGMVTVKDNNDSIYRFTNYETTLSAIRDKLCSKLNGYLRVRKQNGKRYVDLVRIDDYGVVCNQPIAFGNNLLEYSRNFNAMDIATSVIPLGAHLDTEEIPGLDSYLTIKSVNDGKDYINQSDDIINELGMIRVVKHWDDVTVPENLKAKAQEWLSQAQFETITLELNAVDLSNFGADLDTFKIGDKIQITAKPFGIDKLMLPVQKKTTYINDLSKNYITLGNVMQLSYTQQASNAASAIEDKIPQTASFLNEAKNNAFNILTGVNGGYVHFVKNNNDVITDIVIMNAETDELATQKWVFNSGGLGHLEKQDGEWKNLNVAMTMDGSIVADVITSGKLKSIEIEGVTINGAIINTLLNGSINSRRSDGSGVAISGGSIIIYNTRDSYLKIVDAKDPSRYVTLGANTWTVARTNEGYYQEFDPRKLSELAARS